MKPFRNYIHAKFWYWRNHSGPVCVLTGRVETPRRIKLEINQWTGQLTAWRA